MRQVWICAMALLGAFAIAAAAAAAPTDQISINVPVHVSQRTIYDVTINGFSRKRAVAYLFIDYTGCARTFAAEHKRAPNEADYYSVHGTFTEVSGWKSSSSGSDHACAYLIGRASGKLLAKSRVSFVVR
jgi:hypothetical protein